MSAGQCKCPNVLKVFIKLLKSGTYFSPAHYPFTCVCAEHSAQADWRLVNVKSA